MTVSSWSPMDALGEALHVLGTSGTVYCPSELSDRWGATLPEMPGALWFHVVVSGSARLEAGERTVEVGPGDLVLVPGGTRHVLRSSPGAPVPDIRSVSHALDGRRARVRRAGPGPVHVVSGAVRFERPVARSLSAALPDLIHVPASPLGDRFQDTLRMIAREVEEVRPGGEAVIARLADVLVVQALQTWLATDGVGRAGWLAALTDPQVGRALAAIHRDPTRDWTVGALAAEQGLARSTFAARFTALVGEPAMTYVTRWRMDLAHERLRGSDVTVARLARELGYASEAAFSRAFRRVIGEAPGAVRRRVGAAGA